MSTEYKMLLNDDPTCERNLLTPKLGPGLFEMNPKKKSLKILRSVCVCGKLINIKY